MLESSGITRKDLHIYYYEEVNPKSIQGLVSTLREATQLSLDRQLTYDLEIPPVIHLHIHSYGGDVYSGLAGAGHILNNKVPVYTYVEGGVASAGTLLSMVGKKRFMQEYGYMLIHQVSQWTEGTYENLKDEKANLDKLMEQFYKFYKKHSKLKKKQIVKMLKRDLWFNSEECLKHGLVDKLI
jgi:ATP-dependent protease ClpP protease subunit